MAKVILHADLNCFFARCEIIKNPSLQGKPIAVGATSRRGVISTCSYEARAMGVKSGMPTFEALSKCPKLILLPGDYNYYSLMSKEFFAYCHTYTSKVEEASIDECFMDITDVIKGKDVMMFLKSFQSKLYKKTGLMCSLGVGPTRFLAKMGSDYKKPMGITIIRKRDIKSMIYPLKISDFYGIGNRTTPRLKSLGINTIGDLANFINNKEESARQIFGSYLVDIKRNLDGTSDDHIYLEESDPKSIGNSFTLMLDTSDEDEISKALLIMSKEVSERAKNARLKGKTVQLTIKESDFKVHLKSHTLDKAINDVESIHHEAMNLYNKFFKGLEVRLVGVTLQNLMPLHEENVQLSLFEDAPVDKVSDVVNSINRKFNKEVVGKASILLKERRYGNK